MPVTQEQVDALSRIYNFLGKEIKKEGSDAYGIYEKMNVLWVWNKCDVKSNQEEIALRQFARYCYYELKATNGDEAERLLKDELRKTAFLERRLMEDSARETGVSIRDTSLFHWINAQRNTVLSIFLHYKTPIQVEE
jgi:hypothetical protein